MSVSRSYKPLGPCSNPNCVHHVSHCSSSQIPYFLFINATKPPLFRRSLFDRDSTDPIIATPNSARTRTGFPASASSLFCPLGHSWPRLSLAHLPPRAVPVTPYRCHSLFRAQCHIRPATNRALTCQLPCRVSSLRLQHATRNGGRQWLDVTGVLQEQGCPDTFSYIPPFLAFWSTLFHWSSVYCVHALPQLLCRLNFRQGVR